MKPSAKCPPLLDFGLRNERFCFKLMGEETNMPKRVFVARTEDIPLGQGRAFPVDDRMIAVFREGDEFHAIDDMCPHMGASLAEGYLEEGSVACPWHAWRFSIRNGAWLDNPRICVATYPVHIEADQIYIDIPEDNSQPPT
jgi:nitrite reductase (NADH) small subunit